jgi:hypothetical protein
MDPSSSDLSQELAVISDVFSDLGERLLSAARQLHAPGTPPPEKLVEELTASRRDFFAIRDRTRQRAEALRVSCPREDVLNTVQGLSKLIDEIGEAEARRAKGEETRRRAIATLDRTLQLSHTGGGDFAPLREVHDQVRQLRGSIESASWETPHPEAERLALDDHPYVHLLHLVEKRDELNDDQWATLHDSVGERFGKPLAAAAARAKLSLPPVAEAEAQPLAPENRSAQPAEKSPAQGKRNLGRATPSSR